MIYCYNTDLLNIKTKQLARNKATPPTHTHGFGSFGYKAASLINNMTVFYFFLDVVEMEDLGVEEREDLNFQTWICTQKQTARNLRTF